jgi:fatty-acyl-CoA synthase
MTTPAPYQTVAEAIARVGHDWPASGYTFQDLEGRETTYGFAEVEMLTAKRAAALQALGLKKGDRVGLVIIEPEPFVLTFLAAIRIGVVPVPLYPPLSFGNVDAYVERTERILSSAGARVLVTSQRLAKVLWSLVDRVDSLERVAPAEGLGDRTEAGPVYPTITPEDLCFLQYTSGSTADPKGVMVTHASLVANARAIIVEGLELDPRRGDKGVSWLPLYHDMGLIGFVIAPMMYGVGSVFIPTMRFIKRPSVWLDTIHRHRGTASFAPNFAFALAVRRVRESDLAEWDLSCLRVLGCGAEPIQAETMRKFTDLFAEKCNLPRSAVTPAYGMAEATLAISLKRAGDLFSTVSIDAETFSESGRIEAPREGRPAAEHVACGKAFSGHEVAVLDEHGNRMADGVEGELCHRGPSVTSGYFGNPAATAQTWRDGWLRTGDLGFVVDGEIYVTGRIKDLIIVNGRNVHPQSVEWAVAEVDGVRRGNVVAFSIPGELGEELVVLLETKEQDHDRLAADVRTAVQREHGLATREVVCVKPGVVPKTSSGKLQRRKTREMYLAGVLGHETVRPGLATSTSLAVARLVAQSAWSRAKAALRG